MLSMSSRHMEGYSAAAEAIASRVVSSDSLGTGNNLALGRPVTASGAQDDNPPSAAVDGDFVSRWSANTFPHWMIVDLGQITELGRTELVAYEDRAYQFTVEVANTNSGPWTQVVDRTGNTQGGSSVSPIADTISASGRFVRLTVTGANAYGGPWASIEEFRVFGSADSASGCNIQEGVSCARSTARDLGRRVWRRSLTTQEVNILVGIYETTKAKGLSNQDAAAFMIQAMLMSPNFLFRVEIDADRNTTQARDLSGYELASRLSYFIWSSTPDDALLDAAESGQLSSDAGLKAQVTRMLADPKSDALIEQFAVQWLKFDRVQELLSDQAALQALPNFDKAYIEFFRQETRAFIRLSLIHISEPTRPY